MLSAGFFVEIQKALIILKSGLGLEATFVVHVKNQAVSGRLHAGNVLHAQLAPHAVDFDGQKPFSGISRFCLLF